VDLQAAIVPRAASAAQIRALRLWENGGMASPIAVPVARVVPTLESSRVRLRAYRASDAEAMFRLYSDPRVMRYWSFPPWTGIGQARAYLERVQAEMDAGSSVLPWAIATRADDCLVGTVTLFSLSLEQGRAEAGYSLQPEFPGAMAWRAKRCALRWALPSTSCACAASEARRRSRKRTLLPPARAPGLSPERLAARALGWSLGEVCDTALYGVLAEEFLREDATRMTTQ
jgi:RimJ/RimL family protein N-acetyltransferase